MQLSIVVPVYRSAPCLPELARRVQQDIGGHFDTYELVLVNDASPDHTWDTIVQLAATYRFIVGVNLRRNVGQDNAITAGLHHSRGDIVVIMDDDLQHDPSDIPALCQEIRKGCDVVYAQFTTTKHAPWKNLGSRFANRVAVLVLGKPKHLYLSPYKAIRRDVVNEIIKYDGPYSYVDGLILTITSNVEQLPVTHHRRFAGTSNYTFVSSVGVWLKLATGFSVFPLRIAMVTGGIISLLSFLLAALFMMQALLLERMPEGWPSLIVTVFFLGGIQLMGIGAIGEYIGRIFITQNKRPQFTVKEVHRRTPHDAGATPPDVFSEPR